MRKAEVVGEELAWWKFILPADEFFITYAMPASGPEVALFLVGHCAELYLKACLTKLGEAPKRVFGFGHDLSKLISKCAKLDKEFPHDYILRRAVLEAIRDTVGIAPGTVMQDEDREHFFRHQELYIAAYCQGQTRYFGTIMSRPLLVAGAIIPNPYWIDFIRDIRNYLSFPPAGIADRIAQTLEIGSLPEKTSLYLRCLYGDLPASGIPSTISVSFPIPRDVEPEKHGQQPE